MANFSELIITSIPKRMSFSNKNILDVVGTFLISELISHQILTVLFVFDFFQLSKYLLMAFFIGKYGQVVQLINGKTFYLVDFLFRSKPFRLAPVIMTQ